VIPTTGNCTCDGCVPLVKAYHDPDCPAATVYDFRLWLKDSTPEEVAVQMSGMARADLDEIRAAFGATASSTRQPS
jgi:hypothetical protein